MEDRELLLKSDPEFDRLAFTVLAIEASAQKMILLLNLMDLIYPVVQLISME